MFTAAKVVAALIFGFVAWMTAGLVIAHVQEIRPNSQTGSLGLLCLAIGLFSGWVMSGARAGDGIRASIGYGLTTSAMIVFWGLFIVAGEEALQRSLDRRYEGPIQAISDMIKLMLDYGMIMAKPDVIIWLVVGAIFGGVVTELASRQWN
jgi:hypothetical protein